MATDIAQNPSSGDWIFSGNNDFQLVLGDQTVLQRIQTRLRIVKGWDLDPSNGLLGSRLEQALHIPRGRALREIPLMIREALDPMLDIEIGEIQVHEFDGEESGSVRVTIEYEVVESGIIRPLDVQASESVTLEFPI